MSSTSTPLASDDSIGQRFGRWLNRRARRRAEQESADAGLESADRRAHNLERSVGVARRGTARVAGDQGDGYVLKLTRRVGEVVHGRQHDTPTSPYTRRRRTQE